MKYLFGSALLFLTLSGCTVATMTPSPDSEKIQASGVQIESKKLWEAIESGIENSPEIKYARKVGGKLESSYQAELSSAPEVAATPPSKCQKLPPVDVVVSAEGKIKKAINRTRSCWVNGTKMAIKASQALQLSAPPAGLLSNGEFKFSWTPDLPEKKAADKEPVAN